MAHLSEDKKVEDGKDDKEVNDDKKEKEEKEEMDDKEEMNVKEEKDDKEEMNDKEEKDDKEEMDDKEEKDEEYDEEYYKEYYEDYYKDEWDKKVNKKSKCIHRRLESIIMWDLHENEVGKLPYELLNKVREDKNKRLGFSRATGMLLELAVEAISHLSLFVNIVFLNDVLSSTSLQWSTMLIILFLSPLIMLSSTYLYYRLEKLREYDLRDDDWFFSPYQYLLVTPLLIPYMAFFNAYTWFMCSFELALTLAVNVVTFFAYPGNCIANKIEDLYYFMFAFERSEIIMYRRQRSLTQLVFTTIPMMMM